jgi:RNA polymerase sigma factor (sigma-70 family)
MRTELEVSRIFVQFIASGVRHTRIDSYRKREMQAKTMPIYPVEQQLMDRLQLRQPARLLETIPINQIPNLEEYIVNDRLSDAVARLNDTEKFVIYCKTVETMTDAEIGNLLGRSRSAISKQLHRMYKKLLKVYQEDFNGGN